MTTTPSLRQLWSLYKAILVSDLRLTRVELDRLQDSFYAGARGILKVMAHLRERGDYEALHRLIEQHGRQMDRMRARGRPSRH
jgi:hypothetical protein